MGPRLRIVDLTLPVTSDMRGGEMSPAKMLSTDGWNATNLTMYSHAGTHMDAPKHFLVEGDSLDQQDLSVCCGPARLVNLVPSAPRQLISVDEIVAAIGQVNPGDRLLFRTDWHKRFGSSAYRDELPRISIELAHWLAQKRVALIGVEPPSVADVNAKSELTDVHQTLSEAGIVIVQGLANLDELTQAEFEFITLPLKLIGGDGSPVRAIAIEQHGVRGQRVARWVERIVARKWPANAVVRRQTFVAMGKQTTDSRRTGSVPKASAPAGTP